MRKQAKLRVCASCEWIFSIHDYDECPKCKFGHYGARYVYGKKAYQYAKTQKPWLDKQIVKLQLEISKYNTTHKKQQNLTKKTVSLYDCDII